MNTTKEWTPVTKHQPCPSCGKHDWCAWSKDGWLKCHRGGEAPAGMVRVNSDKKGALFLTPQRRLNLGRSSPTTVPTARSTARHRS